MFPLRMLTQLALALAISDVKAGCTSDVDCQNNFDCIHLGFFLGSACVPKTCAEGAVQAMIDEGFDPLTWVHNITSKTGLGRRGFFRGIPSSDASTLQRAYKTAIPPPTDVFTRYYEACINPKSGADSRATLLRSTLLFNGVQFAFAAGFGLTIKNFYARVDDGSVVDFTYCCWGFLAGAHISAISYLAHIATYEVDLDDPNTFPDPDVNPENDQRICVPIVTVGSLQVTICWDELQSIESKNFVEVSFGAQLGASLGGLQFCTNNNDPNNV